jgi:lincosamide nucleotidyltransferase A/C/D/E
MGKLRSTLTRMHLIGLARYIDKSLREVALVGVQFLRRATRLPLVGPALVPLLARIDQRDRFQFEMAELLRVCSTLSDERLPYWVTGGWGIDVLVGCQTRRHADLDFALDSFQENLPKAAEVLRRLGYQRKTPLSGALWFPDADVYEDDRGHHMEVHSISWNVLSMAEVLLDPTRKLEAGVNAPRNRATARQLDQCTAEGILEGVSIPTLSAAAQKLFHLGYQPLRPEDVHFEEVIRLVPLDGHEGFKQKEIVASAQREQGPRSISTLILVPVFSLPNELWRQCRLRHNDLSQMPAHVTLAFPFLPLESVTDNVVQQLSKIFNEFSAFDFEFNEVRWFGKDVVYLEPSKSETFRAMIETLQQAFPDFHPYNDAFDSIIPHVCLSEHGAIADRRSLGRYASKHLPFSSRASHVWLMSNERASDEWSITKIFPLNPAIIHSPSDGLG